MPPSFVPQSISGHNLGLEVVAEGVETEEAKRSLEALGCDTLQGYHLGRPQPASSLTSIGYAMSGRRAAGRHVSAHARSESEQSEHPNDQVGYARRWDESPGSRTRTSTPTVAHAFMFDVALGAHDEFEAANFIALPRLLPPSARLASERR